MVIAVEPSPERRITCISLESLCRSLSWLGEASSVQCAVQRDSVPLCRLVPAVSCCRSPDLRTRAARGESTPLHTLEHRAVWRRFPVTDHPHPSIAMEATLPRRSTPVAECRRRPRGRRNLVFSFSRRLYCRQSVPARALPRLLVAKSLKHLHVLASALRPFSYSSTPPDERTVRDQSKGNKQVITYYVAGCHIPLPSYLRLVAPPTALHDLSFIITNPVPTTQALPIMLGPATPYHFS